MELESYSKILLAGSSAAIGAILGVLRSKIFSSKNSNNLYYLFYIFSGFIFFSMIIVLIFFWGILWNGKNGFDVFVVFTALFSSIGLAWVTWKFLFIKDLFNTADLAPIINSFTSNADRNEIKLFGGDLNFLGNTLTEIDINIQYTHLRSLNFTKVLILCETPSNSTQAIRYGKILSEMPGTQLRFYNPDKADLRVRGRIIKTNGVDKLLIYNKIKSGSYQAIHTDTSNSSGALYNNIWDLVWGMAKVPHQNDIALYITQFKGGN